MAHLCFRELSTRLTHLSPFDRALFDRAQSRHPALRPFTNPLDAARTAASTRDQTQRDTIVAALTHEYRSTQRSLWSAAAIVSMAPVLGSLARAIRTRAERNEAESLVVLAFLEAVNRITTEHRMAFRLYSETRRSVLRTQRFRLATDIRVHHTDVDRIPVENDAEIGTRSRPPDRASPSVPTPAR